MANRHIYASIKLVIYLSLIVALVFLRDQYTYVTSHLAMPEKFEHTIYRVFLAFCVVEAVRMMIMLTYKTQNKRKKDNFTIGVSHASRILYGVMVIILILAMFNISVKEAITSLSLIAAAIVLITKDYISNLINGMYMTFNRVINLGDQVKIGTQKGKIVDITLTNVHVMNDDDDLVYIPNNVVFSSEIINYTRRELKKTSIEFEVEPLLTSDLLELERKLVSAMESYSGDIQPNTYSLKVVGVKWDSVQLKFQYILNEPLNKELDKKIRKHFLHQMLLLFYGKSREIGGNGGFPRNPGPTQSSFRETL